MNLGEKIKNLRMKNNLTQEQLAEKLFVTRTAVSKWERNGGYPNIDSLKLIAEFFSISLDELLSGEEIITIAKEEKVNAVRNFARLIYAIIDLAVIILVFLPIFGLKEGEQVKFVMMFSCGALFFINLSWAVLISVLVLCGIAELISYFLSNEKFERVIRFFSICSGAILMLLFIITLEPYAAVLSFILLALKALLTFKYQRIEK